GGGWLMVKVAYQPDLELLGQEARRSPIEVEIDAALIAGVGIDEVVGHSPHRRKFIPALLVEIGVADAAVQRVVPDADVREAGRIVGAEPKVAGHEGHHGVNTGSPP